MAQSTARTPGQTFALAFGAIYVLVGIAGLFVAKDFTGGSANDELIVFPLNHLHNLVHIGVGALWLFASTQPTLARNVNLLIGVTYLLVAVLGFTGIDLMHTLLNISSASSADNFLHLGSAALALYFGWSGAITGGQRVEAQT